METRKWVKWSYENTLMLIREIAGEIRFIKHVENCERCLIELQLDVERYGGSRSIWYMDIRNEEFTRQDWRYKDMPYPGDYKIGSYWTGSSEDTIRFIKDRLKWAEKIARKEIVAAVKYLKLIMSWDIDWELSLFFGVDYEQRTTSTNATDTCQEIQGKSSEEAAVRNTP